MNHSTTTLSDLRERVDNIRFAMLTNGDERGMLSSRPLTVQLVDDHGDVFFIVDREADWMVVGVDAVNVSLVDEGRTWLSIAGRAIIDDDKALLDELWDPMTDAYFPEGKDSGKPVVLRVQADRWEYWTAPNKLAQLVTLVKAKAKGSAPDLGESGIIET